MIVRLTKLSDERHRFEAWRDDGSHEAADLETRSLLLHDLVHYAVESRAGLARGFFGCLAAGVSLARLGDREAPLMDEEPDLAYAERLVGPMQSLFRGRMTRARYLELTHLDAAFVTDVLEHLRRLDGRWRATRYRDAMDLPWPAAGPPPLASP